MVSENWQLFTFELVQELRREQLISNGRRFSTVIWIDGDRH